MIISLIGMSNAGKTHWAKKLERAGFEHYCCDDLIEAKLGPELKRLGYHGIHDVAKWMGQPYDFQYPHTSKKYLQFEQEVMHELLNILADKIYGNYNIIIDTTGSVIYTGEDILKKLSQLTKVIYIHTPEEIQQVMYENYIKDPKPVIWGNSFNMLSDESNHAALARCYPQLLQYRSAQYEKYAQLTLDYYELRAPDFTHEHLLAKVEALQIAE